MQEGQEAIVEFFEQPVEHCARNAVVRKHARHRGATYPSLGGHMRHSIENARALHLQNLLPRDSSLASAKNAPVSQRLPPTQASPCPSSYWTSPIPAESDATFRMRAMIASSISARRE